MIGRMALGAGIASILAACSPPPAQQNAGPAAAAAPSGIQPGQYRTTVTMLETNIPGVDMTPTVTENCVTSADISQFAQSTPPGPGETCTQNSMSTAGGRIEGVTSCTGPEVTRTMRVSGTYSANRIDMEIGSTTAVSGADATTMRIRMESERIGECPVNTDAD